MFGPLGLPELIFIMVLALLIFGPRKLPEIGRTLGRGLSEFRKASSDLKRSIDAEMLREELRQSDPRNLLREDRETKTRATASATAEDAGSVAPTSPEPDPDPASDHPAAPAATVARGTSLDDEAERPAETAASSRDREQDETKT